MRSEFASGLFAAILVAISTTPLLASNTSASYGRLGSARPTFRAGYGHHDAAGPRRSGISLTSGKVEYRAPNEAQWSPAAVNDPIAAGVALRTGPQTRAEIRIGADTIDLAEGTEIAIVKLDQLMAEIAVRGGRVNLDIPRVRPRRNFADRHVDRWGLVATARTLRYRCRRRRSCGCVSPSLPGRRAFVGNGGDLPIAAGDRIVFGPPRRKRRTSRLPVTSFLNGAATARLMIPGWRHRILSREMTGYAELDQAGRLAGERQIRPSLDAKSARRMGALSRWALALVSAVGVELGRQPALGLCHLALRPLDSPTTNGRGRPANGWQIRYGRRRSLPFSALPASGSAMPTDPVRRSPGFPWRQARSIGPAIPMTRVHPSRQSRQYRRSRYDRPAAGRRPPAGIANAHFVNRRSLASFPARPLSPASRLPRRS